MSTSLDASQSHNEQDPQPYRHPAGVEVYVPGAQILSETYAQEQEFLASKGRGPQGTPRPEIDFENIQYPARIAVYDDQFSSPRVVMIKPCEVDKYLNQISIATFELSQQKQGIIPYTVIRELVENFIHAAFIEPTVSIFDQGNTIRFTDQGPGISNIEMAKKPGVTSANYRMKRYIRGVGSGLPQVNSYLSMVGGSLQIENNIHSGCVVTISVANKIEALQQNTSIAQDNTLQAGAIQTPQTPQVQPVTQPPQSYQSYPGQAPYPQQAYPQGAYPAPYQQVPHIQITQPGIHEAYTPTAQAAPSPMPTSFEEYQRFIQAKQDKHSADQDNPIDDPEVNSRRESILRLSLQIGKLGPTDIEKHLNISQSTAFRDLKALEAAGFLTADDIGNKKRSLTQAGFEYLQDLQ